MIKFLYTDHTRTHKHTHVYKKPDRTDNTVLVCRPHTHTHKHTQTHINVDHTVHTADRVLIHKPLKYAQIHKRHNDTYELSHQ